MYANKLPLVVCYDFDETLYHIDTDSVCGSMLNLNLSQLSREFEGWNKMMQHVVTRLHEQGITPEDIKRNLNNYSMTPGFEDTVRAWAKAGVPQFIVSDANSMNIRLTLEAKGLSEIFPPHHMYTNHMTYHPDEGYKMEYHHNNTWTRDSPLNMDKAVAVAHLLGRLSDPNTQVKQDGISNALSDAHIIPSVPNAMFPCVFRTSATVPAPARHEGSVLYFGDGYNDYRGAQFLTCRDTLGCRENYGCHVAIQRTLSNGGEYAPRLQPWESALSIKQACASTALAAGVQATFVDHDTATVVNEEKTTDTIKSVV